VFYARSKFLCSLASFKLSSLGVRHLSHIYFAQLLFDKAFVQTYSFADVNCADVALGSTPIC